MRLHGRERLDLFSTSASELHIGPGKQSYEACCYRYPRESEQNSLDWAELNSDIRPLLPYQDNARRFPLSDVKVALSSVPSQTACAQLFRWETMSSTVDAEPSKDSLGWMRPSFDSEYAFVRALVNLSRRFYGGRILSNRRSRSL